MTQGQFYAVKVNLNHLWGWGVFGVQWSPNFRVWGTVEKEARGFGWGTPEKGPGGGSYQGGGSLTPVCQGCPWRVTSHLSFCKTKLVLGGSSKIITLKKSNATLPESVVPFSFIGGSYGMQKFLGQGSRPRHSNDLSHSSDDAGSLTC